MIFSEYLLSDSIYRKLIESFLVVGICTPTPGGLLQGLMANVEGVEAIMTDAKTATDSCSSYTDEDSCA